MKRSYICLISILLCYLVCEVNGCWRRHTDLTVEQKTKDTKVSEVNSKVRSNASTVSNEELKKLSEELFKLDNNNVGHLIQLNLQGITTSSARNDAAPSPLFASTSTDKLFKGSTTQSFNKLLDNYVELVTKDDLPTFAEKKEQSEFLDAIMATPIMKKTENFLKQHAAINGTLRKNLDEIWFTPYSRSKGKIGSSGFEHVFLGELKNGLVSGLHNWIFFRKEESKKFVDYKGYIKVLDFGKGEIIKLRFDWKNKRKSVGSMFVGTSPELEMALYTVCFYTRLNKGCSLTMNNKKFKIKVYSYQRGNKNVIGSAFPVIY